MRHVFVILKKLLHLAVTCFLICMSCSKSICRCKTLTNLTQCYYLGSHIIYNFLLHIYGEEHYATIFQTGSDYMKDNIFKLQRKIWRPDWKSHWFCQLYMQLKWLWKLEKNLLLNGIPVQCFTNWTNWTITPTASWSVSKKWKIYVFFVKYKFNISLLYLQRLKTKHTFLRLKMILMKFLSFQHTRPHKVYWQLQNKAGFYWPGGGNPKRSTKRKADCNKSYRSTECS